MREKTGLVLDPYFSATKIAWLLDHVRGARKRAESGAAAFGAIDSWLLWKPTGGAVRATDLSNASRTLLMDLQTRALGSGAAGALRGAGQNPASHRHLVGGLWG